MKKLLFAVVIAAVIAGCNGPGNGYRISGEVSGLEEGYVYLINNYGVKLDSAALKGNKFTLKSAEAEAGVFLLADNSVRPFVTIFLEPGASVKVSGDAQQEETVVITGTLANQRYNEFNAKRQALASRLQSAPDQNAARAIFEEDEANANAALNDNLDNIFGLYMLTEMTYNWEPAEVLAKLDEFSPEMQATTIGTEIREKQTNLRDAMARTAVGQPFIDITLPDPKGEPLTLSSFTGKGKYVLIDFWASWCGPCMGEMPHLANAYNKYHEKGFEIYAVSIDRSREQWLETIESNNMPWKHVFHASADQAGKDYAVRTIPANFLVGPDGIIIARNLRGEEVEEKLAEVLKSKR